MKKSKMAQWVGMMTAALIGVGMFLPVLAGAGSLEPSAAPAPTMKTLDEIEPRIPIPGSDTAVSVYTINQSGAYYLTADRLCSETGIEVRTHNVTIDLMGYSLIGSGTDNGIDIMYGPRNVEIRNGTVRGFDNGIYEDSSAGEGHRIINVRVVGNASSGIYLNSEGNLVKECSVIQNGDSASSDVYGIYVRNGNTVSGNTVSDNGRSVDGTFYGIRANGSTVIHNTVCGNGSSCTGTVYGIWASSSTVSNNTAFRNGQPAGGGAVYGIYADSSTVANNTCYMNGLSATHTDVYGIKASGSIVNNTSYYNGNLATGTVYGIYAGSGSMVTNNMATLNGSPEATAVWGIYLQGNNLVDQNSAYNNKGTNMNTCAPCAVGLNHAP